jgi:tetratricopeptide (TPR) repeat protein
MIYLEKTDRIFKSLLLFSCFLFSGISLSANGPSNQLPDSMSTYVSLINELLKQEVSEENQKDFPPSLVLFLNDLRITKTKIGQEELNYLAYVYRGFLETLDGNYNNALSSYELGRCFLAKVRPYNKLLGHFYLLRANALFNSGDTTRGLQSLEDAAEVFSLKKDFYFLNRVYLAESDFYFRSKEPEKAIAALNKSINSNKKDTTSKINSLIKRGELYSALKQFGKADEDFKSAKTLLPKNDSKQNGELNAARGEHFLRQEKPEEALALYDEALEQLCPGIRNEKFAAFKNCNNPSAFLSTLKLRGAILYQSIENNANVSSLKRLYNNNITGIRFLQHLQSSDATTLLKNESNQHLDFFIENGINTCFLLQELDNQNNLYIQNAINLSNLRNQTGSIHTLLVADLQELAKKENQTLLSFFYGEKQLYLFTIHPGGRQFIRIPKDELLEKDLLQLINMHHLPLQSIAAITLFKELSYGLYQSLFKGLKISTDKLVIIPDGFLSFLPFESFVTTLDKATEHPVDYLLFHKQITYAHSFSQLQKDLNTSPLNTRSVFTFAPMVFKKHGLIPLKGTPGHIRFLEVKFQSEKWINAEAIAANFQNLWPESKHNIIVFNTHATAEKSPSIAFHDQYLPTEELPTMNANMAVINNCKTPVLDSSKTNSALLFSNSFSERNIPSTITPLWAVPNQKTVRLMELFYLNLASGMEKDVSMTSAKIDYLKGCGNDAISCSPHFWAGIVLTGNTKALYEKSYLLPLIIIGLFALLLLAWKSAQK